MTPETRRTLIRVGAGIGFLIILIWLMRAIESVTIMVLVSFFIAYLLDPLADQLEEWGIRRSLAALIILLAFFMVVVGVLLFIVPVIVVEVSKFAASTPKYFSALRSHFADLMVRFGVPGFDSWENIWPLIMEKGRDLLAKLPTLADPVARLSGAIFRSTMSLISLLVYLALIPVLIYYFLVSYDNIRDEILDLIPRYMREPIVEKLYQMDRVVAGFVRGQLTICCILAVLYSIGFVIIGIDLAIVLGVLSGLLFIVPYVGTMIGVVGGSLMALAQGGGAIQVVYVVGWIAVVQLTESYVLTPRIVGEATGLHPVVYILALIVGANLLGFVGMLVAIPVAAIIKVLLASALESYRESYLYQDHKAEEEEA